MHQRGKLLTPILFIALLLLAPLRMVQAMPNVDDIASQAINLSPKLIQLGYTAYQHAIKNGFDDSGVVTLVDFTKPDTDKRLWVIDYKTNKVLFHTWTAQGKDSGLKVADHFSNKPGTHASSIGVYKTGQTYVGEHGKSLRLIGLDPQFNSNALSRDIVVHPAWYVSPNFIHEHGYLGRSWGCFALDKTVAEKIINKIKGGTLLVAYYPNQTWLSHSKYLQPLTS